MQPVYLPLTAESEEAKAEETIVLSNETLLQKFTIHFSILPWNGGKVAKRDCVKYFDYDKMKCKPCLRTRDTGDYFIRIKKDGVNHWDAILLIRKFLLRTETGSFCWQMVPILCG